MPAPLAHGVVAGRMPSTGRAAINDRSSVATALRLVAGPPELPVARSAWMLDEGRCSCLRAHCPMPGGHPLGVDGRGTGWEQEATTDPHEVLRLWRLSPHAGVVVPTGDAFAAIDLPVTAGARLVARARQQGVPIGPIATRGGRWSVFVSGNHQPLVRRGRLVAVGARLLGAGNYLVWPLPGRTDGGRWLRKPSGMDWPAMLPTAHRVLSAAETAARFGVSGDLAAHRFLPGAPAARGGSLPHAAPAGDDMTSTATSPEGVTGHWVLRPAMAGAGAQPWFTTEGGIHRTAHQ